MTPQSVTIVEVGPRDGFQMEKAFIPTELKIRVIDLLSDSGLRSIEATSFVNPKVIPQMADAAEVMSRIARRAGTTYKVLVPNLKGAERAIEAGADALELVIVASESYNRKNVGMSVDQSIAACGDIAKLAASRSVPLEVVIGTSFGCPIEGPVPETQVERIARAVAAFGISRLSLADSVGSGNPGQVTRLVTRIKAALPSVPLSLHLHNTRGLGLANAVAGFQAGIDTFDAGLGGLGGCPVFPGATGNVATEDIVNLFEEMGVSTGVNLDKVKEASRLMQQFLERPLPSYILRVGTTAELFAKASLRGSSSNEGDEATPSPPYSPIHRPSQTT